MKLIIDIPKKTFEELQQGVFITVGETFAKRLIKYIENGIPLNKITAEIEEHAKINQNLNTDRARALCWCLDVIDKYKSESEEV